MESRKFFVGEGVVGEGGGRRNFKSIVPKGNGVAGIVGGGGGLGVGGFHWGRLYGGAVSTFSIFQ